MSGFRLPLLLPLRSFPVSVIDQLLLCCIAPYLLSYTTIFFCRLWRLRMPSRHDEKAGDGMSISASSVTLAAWSSSSVGKQIGHQWPPDLASSCLGFEGHRSMELRAVLSDVVRTGVVRSAKSASGPLRKSLRPLVRAGQNPDFPYGGGLWVGHLGPGLVPKITPAAPLGGSGRCRRWWSVSLYPVSMAPI